ncbi:MAG: leucyl aminopeptidase [Promethearchaeota archaeon]
MDIRVEHGSIEEKECDIGVLGVFENETSDFTSKSLQVVDSTLQGAIRELIMSKEFSGKLNTLDMLRIKDALPVKRILIAGLGKKNEFSLERLRQVSGKTAVRTRELNIQEIVTTLQEIRLGTTPRDAAQAVIEGSMLGTYQFAELKTQNADTFPIKKILLLERDVVVIDEVREGANQGNIIADSTNFTRDLANMPANIATPSYFAAKAKELATRYGLKCDVIDESAAKEIGMNAFLSVAQGSDQPAKFIILEYTSPDKEKLDTIVVVGKAITFDSGGLSLKQKLGMENMKYDKSGGCTVLGLMQAVSQLKLPVHLVGLIPATENLPGGNAIKPGDIVKSLSGKTIEIVNTDAEGRLVLADALTYAKKYTPTLVMDLATLTGAIRITLGTHASGLMVNKEGNNFKELLKKAGEKTGERVWELPLWNAYSTHIKSDFADVKNVGGREGAAIIAAAFLSQFVEKGIPWIHLDIAGTARSDRTKAYTPKGATGVGVRLIVQFIRDLIRN